jgi:hypothetical protein
MLNQIGRQGGQSIISALGPAIFDAHVLALDVASFGQALVKSRDQLAPRLQRPGI